MGVSLPDLSVGRTPNPPDGAVPPTGRDQPRPASASISATIASAASQFTV